MPINLPPFPKRIEIELSCSCNLMCVYCPRRYLDALSGFIDYNLFEKLILEATPFPETILVLHRRGESLLHPRFVSLLQLVRGRFGEVQLATNATLLNREKAEAIIDSVTFLSFSLESPGKYSQVRRPANYAEVRANILNFLEMNLQRGNPVQTQVSMVKTQDTTDDDIEEFRREWDGKVDRIRIYEEHSANGKFGSLSQRRPERKPCVMPFYEMLIYCDGKTGRCNHDWDGAPVGDVSNSSIKEIWNSEAYEDLRQQHLNLSISDSVCASCDSWYPEIGNQGTGQVIKK